MKIQCRTTAAAAWLACAGAACVFSPSSFAETTFKVSGYGTLAGTVTDDSDYEFRSSMNQSKGARKGFDFLTDSKLGVQAVANFNNGFSVTGQLLGQRRRVDRTGDSNSDVEVGFEWLYAQYSPTTNLDLRAGRVVLPAFMISDSRNVGYSQPWLRAPMSVYAGMPMTNLDGAQINWRIPAGSAIISVQPTYGQSSFNVSSGTPAGPLVIKDRSKWTAGLNVALEYGDWMVKAGQVRSHTPGVDLRLFGASLPGVTYDLKDNFTSAGIQFDNGTAVVMAEWARRKMGEMPLNANLGVPWDSIYLGTGYAGKPLAKSQAFYVAGGWRFGQVLPMLAYGQTRNMFTGEKNREVSGSVRWDFMNNVALKAQLSRYQARDTQAFVSPAAAGTPDYSNKKVNVFSVGLDFVF